MNQNCPKTACQWHNPNTEEHCGAPSAEDMQSVLCPYMDRLVGRPCRACGQIHEYEIRQWGSGKIKYTVRKHEAHGDQDGLSFHWQYGELGKPEVPLAHLGFAFGEIECLRNQLAALKAENERLRDYLPDPVACSGWDDDGADPGLLADLAALAGLKGIPRERWPEHIAEAAKETGNADE